MFKNHPFRILSIRIFVGACIAGLFAVVAIWAISNLSEQNTLAKDDAASRKTGVEIVETWVEEWNSEKRCWIRIDQPSAGCSSEVRRLPPDEVVAPSPRFGPFVVLNDRVAGIVGTTNSESLSDFGRMMTAFPDINQLDFIDAAGTSNDVTNIKLGRMIRAIGMSTHVPSNGSARSGAVDLFIAGVRRTMEKGARFAVHCWSDSYGRGPHDFPEHHTVNELYLDYYMDMGMSHDKSHEFYAMTNSVPHSAALWFGPEEMQVWLDLPSSNDREKENEQHRAERSWSLERGSKTPQCPAAHFHIK